MTTLEIIQLCVIGIAVFAILIYCLVVGIKNKWFKQLLETMNTAINEAETKFPEQGSGEQKKAYVLEKVKVKCDELCIPYELLKKLINVAIEKIIEHYNIISK